MFTAELLKGKRALITGGGTGLGRAMAKRYLELGATVYICGRREDVLQATCRELAAETNGTISGIPCDVRDLAAVESLIDTIWNDGPLDILVNNAAG
ncbi:MAG TPA: SDR family NAD(P)-dependent oxidoreductase, partial [Terriglobales bacterium]|nr:SDR family NAD(P)-dependent oxidoreductase [Terriglobales bacterium]